MKNFGGQYNIMLGQFEEENEGFTMWLFFIMATLIFLVIMYNMFVAIIEKVFERHYEKSSCGDYKRLAEVVLELECFVQDYECGKCRRVQQSNDETYCHNNHIIFA